MNQWAPGYLRLWDGISIGGGDARALREAWEHEKETLPFTDTVLNELRHRLYLEQGQLYRDHVGTTMLKLSCDSEQVEEQMGLNEPTPHELHCYLLYSAGENYLVGKHNVTRPKQSEIFGVLETSFRNEIEVERVPDSFELPDSEQAFMKAYRRCRHKLSRTPLPDSDN